MGAASYPVGALVRARGREWVVMPSDEPDLVRLRPLTGGEAERCAIFLPLEPDALEPARFPSPDAAQPGNFVAGRLVRDAARLSLRSTAAPFRSLTRVAVYGVAGGAAGDPAAVVGVEPGDRGAGGG